MNVMSKNILTMIVSVFSIRVSAGVLAETTMLHYHPKGKMPSKNTVQWRIFIFSAILALTGLFYTPLLDAEIYQWVDENGVKHYSNTPPADAENVKIVSQEYRHDEAADQERVKTDQKKMNALTEKTKKGKQQASVEEQKKLEASKQKQTPSAAEDTKADTSCYLKAAVDVRVIVWPADKSGNKGEKMWEGVLKEGERKLIRTPHGRIRYASTTVIDEREPPLSGDTGRSCQNGEIITVP